LLDGDKAQASFTAGEITDGEEITYTFILTVTDAAGQNAADSSEVTVRDFEKKNPGTSGGGCFIATAAYGSLMDSHANLSNEFRDRFLLTKPLGEEFMQQYHTYSPPVATPVAKYETLREVFRSILLPFAILSCVILATLLTLLITARKRQRRRSFVR
jgi:hypothetical protein